MSFELLLASFKSFERCTALAERKKIDVPDSALTLWTEQDLFKNLLQLTDLF